MRIRSAEQAFRVGLVVPLAFFWILMNAMGRGFVGWSRLALDGQQAVATVTRVLPHGKRACEFAWVVEGRTYTARESGCGALGVGGTLPILYLPTQPAVGSSRDPGAELAFEFFAPLALSLVAAFGTARRWRHADAHRRAS